LAGLNQGQPNFTIYTLKLIRVPDRPYLALSEVGIWGYADEKR